jgi:hypothetical protein
VSADNRVLPAPFPTARGHTVPAMTRAGDLFEKPVTDERALVRVGGVERDVQRVLVAVARLCGVRATYAHHGPLMRRQAQEAGRPTRIAA